MSFTPEPEPPSGSEAILPATAGTLKQYGCVVCTQFFPSLSASLEHLDSSKCHSHTAEKIRDLQRFWYPWESANIYELDVRTMDYTMEYYCPTCKKTYETIARAVAHMEEAVKLCAPEAKRSQSAGLRTSTSADQHSLALQALESGLDTLKMRFDLTKGADAMVDVMVNTYTPYASFSNTMTREELERMIKIAENAKKAYAEMAAKGK